jgi:hypothetical protein
MKIELTAKQAKAYSRGAVVELWRPVEMWDPNYNLLNLADHLAYRRYNAILAYVREFGGDWVADWDDCSQYKCRICLNYSDSGYYKDCDNLHSSTEVYMSEECAEGLVEKLTTGEVVL